MHTINEKRGMLKRIATNVNKVGKPFSWLPPYPTARALFRHTAYQYVTNEFLV